MGVIIYKHSEIADMDLLITCLNNVGGIPQLECQKTVVFGDCNIDLLSKERYLTQYISELNESGIIKDCYKPSDYKCNKAYAQSFNNRFSFLRPLIIIP